MFGVHQMVALVYNCCAIGTFGAWEGCTSLKQVGQTYEVPHVLIGKFIGKDKRKSLE